MVECRLCKRRVNWQKGEGYQSVKDGEFLCSAECKVAELLVRLSDTSVLYNLARADVVRLADERDAVRCAFGLHPDTEHDSLLAHIESVRHEARAYPELQLERDAASAEVERLRVALEKIRFLPRDDTAPEVYWFASQKLVADALAQPAKPAGEE